MKKRHVICLLVGVSIAASVASAPARDDFYVEQLQAAKVSITAGDLVVAADQLRVAAFGFLERPPLLLETLARLTVVQSALGREEAVDATLGRFADVERRFRAFSRVNLEASIAHDFEILRRRMATDVAATPPAPRIDLPNPAEAAALQKPVVPPVTPAPAPAAEPDEADYRHAAIDLPRPRRTAVALPLRAAESSPPAQQKNQAAPQVKKPGVSRNEIEHVLFESRKHLRAGRRTEAVVLFAPLLRSSPESRELRLALLEVATLARDWQTAVAQIDLVEPFLESESLRRFYAAVALYETGELEEARVHAEIVQRQLQSTPYISSYLAKILRNQ